MPGNLHVRFGEGDEETCPGNGVKRFIPTLLARADQPEIRTRPWCWRREASGGVFMATMMWLAREARPRSVS
jgi:hypothetical protein